MRCGRQNCSLSAYKIKLSALRRASILPVHLQGLLHKVPADVTSRPALGETSFRPWLTCTGLQSIEGGPYQGKLFKAIRT